MKKLPLLLFIVLLIAACNVQKRTHSSKHSFSNEVIAGIWTEHWEADSSETDVTYVDTIRIVTDKRGELNLNCINNSNYKYSNINFDGEELRFTMENTSGTEDRFFVYYTLRLDKGKTLMQGEIVNSLDSRVLIKMIKL